MRAHWRRCAPLSAQPAPAGRVELWELIEQGQVRASFAVETRYGKPLDVLALKGGRCRDLRDYADFLRTTGQRLYGGGAALRRLESCPCCDAPADTARETLAVHGGVYVRCPECGHLFVNPQPDPLEMQRIFTESEAHSGTYVDKSALDTRLAQVIGPKLDWVLGVFDRLGLGRPARCADVGAGGGHFLEGLRRAGLSGVGYELSTASRKFALEAFGLTLSAEDFTAGVPPAPFDLITFWGLLEYLPDPKAFVLAARRRIAPGGLLVLEVPRCDCLGTAIQGQWPRHVARHMDPTSHLQCFSDASLASVLHACGFAPVAAWYFGMDVYELLTQLELNLDRPGLASEAIGLVPGLQACLDNGRLCDDLVVAARPLQEDARP